MQVRAFRSEDFETIRAWKLRRDTYFPPASHFPKNGFIVDDLACIFLQKTDSAIAYLEFFMSNPDKPLEERLEAFDALIFAAEGCALASGFTCLIGNTSIPKVMALGLRYNFTTDGIPYYFFRKTLGDPHVRSPNHRPDPSPFANSQTATYPGKETGPTGRCTEE